MLESVELEIDVDDKLVGMEDDELQLVGDEIELWVNETEPADDVDENDGNGAEGVVTVIEGVEVDGVQLDDPGDGKCGSCVLLFFIL